MIWRGASGGGENEDDEGDVSAGGSEAGRIFFFFAAAAGVVEVSEVRRWKVHVRAEVMVPGILGNEADAVLMIVPVGGNGMEW